MDRRKFIKSIFATGTVIVVAPYTFLKVTEQRIVLPSVSSDLLGSKIAHLYPLYPVEQYPLFTILREMGIKPVVNKSWKTEYYEHPR